MPRGRGKAAAKETEPIEPVEPEKVELDETVELEEEIEYEEVEEEVDEEEEEVIQEEEDDDCEEEHEDAVPSGADADDAGSNEVEIKDAMQCENRSAEHAELLALPPHGSEIYVGGVMHDATEEELKTFCESVGEVTEVRLMKGKQSHDNRIYAFVTYRTKELALEAIKDLNNTEFKGKKLKCSTSQAKHRLFLGNVPRHWTEDDLRNEVEKLGPGITLMELLKDPQNSSRNRGFAFIEYYNHACAEYSRNKMSNSAFKLESNSPTVSWADPKSGDSSASQQVKAVYVKNIPKNTTQEQLGKLFKHHGEISKVVLPPARSGQENRFGFVHFRERSSAMKALKNTEKYEIDGQVLECSLAKPSPSTTTRKGSSDSGGNAQKGPLIPSYSTPAAYGVMGGAYGGAMAAGYGQPMMYGRAAAPMGMPAAMVPMILPDGRFAYVMQQPGELVRAPPPKGNSRGSGLGSSRQGGGSGGRGGRRFRPY